MFCKSEFYLPSIDRGDSWLYININIYLLVDFILKIIHKYKNNIFNLKYCDISGKNKIKSGGGGV